MCTFALYKLESMAYIVRHLNEIAPKPTSHDIGLKQVLLANDETSSAITQIAKTVLKKGERVGEHVHPTMDEHYLGLFGSGVLWVDDQEIALVKDTYVLVKAGSKHHLEAKDDVCFLTIGVATN